MATSANAAAPIGAADTGTSNAESDSGAAHAGKDESPSPEWQFSAISGRITQSFQLYKQRIEGLPDYQERLDLELEMGLSNGTYGFKAVPWGWVRVPDAQGGLRRQARGFGDFKEAWVERVGTLIDLRAGNQIFSWGTADQINPTDVWNPRDFYDLLQSPKLPIAALDIKIHPEQLEHLSLELIATPIFRASRLPVNIPDAGEGNRPFTLNDSRWFLPFPTAVNNTGATFAAPLQYEMTEATYPSTWQGGVRLRVTSIGGWDFSVSYANLVESLPRFAITTAGNANNPALPVVITLHPSFHRQQVLGFDGAGSVAIGQSEIGTRFEAAYYFRDNSRADAAPAAFQADLRRDDYLHIAAGLDYTVKRKLLGTVLYWNFQYVHYQRMGSLEQVPGRYSIQGLPNVLPWDRNLVLFFEDRIGTNSQFKLQGTVVTSFQNHDSLLAPSIQYAWTDNFKTSFGADIFIGDASGFFGQFRDNTRFNFGAGYSF